MEKVQTSKLYEYLTWDSAMNLVERILNDGDFRMTIILGFGFFCGLDVEDTRKLKWSQIIHSRDFIIKEANTGKTRQVRICNRLQEIVGRCYVSLNVSDETQYCLLAEDGTVISQQEIARRFEEIRLQYCIPVERFDNQTLLKTFGRKIVENAGNQPEMALLVLKDFFGHLSIDETREFLCLNS